MKFVFWALAAIILLIGVVATTALLRSTAAKHRLVRVYEDVALSAEQLQISSEYRARKLRLLVITRKDNDRGQLQTARQDFRRAVTRLEEGAGGSQLRDDLLRVREADEALSSAENEIDGLIRAGTGSAAVETRVLEEVLPIRDDLDEAVRTVTRHADHILAATRQESDRTDRLAISILTSTLICALAVLGVLSVALRRALHRVARVQSRLEQTNRRPEDANRFQQRVMGIVGHDIRAPLSVILMAASMSPKQVTNGTRRETLQECIIRNAKRVEQLVGVLMDVMRVQSGFPLPIARQPAHLHELVDHLVADARVAHRDRVVEYQATGDGRGIFDEERLGQVVVNLIDNALKHSPAGTVVRVYSSGDADHLDIEVHNAGRIAPELMTRLFDPFTKGDPSSTASRFSAGLGLYIAREIAEAHGGTIDVQSSREEGTTFRVRLPRNPRVREERESGWAQTA